MKYLAAHLFLLFSSLLQEEIRESAKSASF
jgi:hypothetical protein